MIRLLNIFFCSLSLGIALWGGGAFAETSCADYLQDTVKAESPFVNRSDLEKAKLAKLWRSTGLSREVIEATGLFSEENCRGRGLAECLTFLDALARTGDPQLALVPKAAEPLYAEEIKSVVKDLDGLLLVKLVKDFTPDPTLGVKRLVQLKVDRDIVFRREVDKLARARKLNFSQIWNEVMDRVLEAGRESAQLAEAVSVFLRLNDFHSKIQSDNEWKISAKSEGESKFAGIGVKVTYVSEGLRVTDLVPGGPAQKSGIHVDDVITHVDGVGLKHTSWYRMALRVEGPTGSDVRLRILREGESLSVTAKRGRILMANVSGELIENDGRPIGYIRLRSFGNDSACKDVAAQIKDLSGRGATSLILDLRENHGGFMPEAQCIAGLFLGKVLVARQLNSDSGKKIDILGTRKQLTDLPLVVLVDADSASASELLAGALRDHKRALLLGETTFGKGTVQNVVLLPLLDPKGRILMSRTVARFEQPTGSSNQLVGIEPHFAVPRHPSGEWDDIPREADFKPVTLPPSKKQWRPKVTAEMRRIQNCMEERGVADAAFAEQVRSGEAADYRLLKGIDLINCL